MASVNEIPAEKLLKLTAEKLKEKPEMAMPEWSKFVRTGVAKQRPPQQEDWWWMRGASIMRKVYLQKQGVSKLKKVYSSRKNRGHKPERRATASGKIIRVLLKQLEEAGFVKIKKGEGRVISSEGQKFLDGISKELR